MTIPAMAPPERPPEPDVELPPRSAPVDTLVEVDVAAVLDEAGEVGIWDVVTLNHSVSNESVPPWKGICPAFIHKA